MFLAMFGDGTEPRTFVHIALDMGEMFLKNKGFGDDEGEKESLESGFLERLTINRDRSSEGSYVHGSTRNFIMTYFTGQS